VVSVGSPKLLVEVADAATLYGLQPDLPAIAAWGKGAGVNGLYVYCRCDDGTYEGRNFNHLDPALEDSATGVAAGALTALLGHAITLRQGRAVGSANLIGRGHPRGRTLRTSYCKASAMPGAGPAPGLNFLLNQVHIPHILLHRHRSE
jgi:predicted PhzF superfamily epimerase YddE/YHI9